MSGGARLHVVGAGLAGLAAAVAARRAGWEVALYEAAAEAGGRCRSFLDERLGRVIDNGSHLLLGGNRAARAFVATVGAGDTIEEVRPARFPFRDLGDGTTWTLRPGPGPSPLWIASPARRVPGTRAGDYLAALRLAGAGAGERVTDRLDARAPLFARLWRPLTRAALNTEPEEASARLLWSVIRASLLCGEAASRPLLARFGLAATFVAPALAWLARRGVAVNFGHRLAALAETGGRVRALAFAAADVGLGAGDAVILALPAHALPALWPGAPAPGPQRAIVNVHFRCDGPVSLPGGAPFLGLIGGTADWLFPRGDVLSASRSAANDLARLPPGEVAARMWRDAARALGRPASPLPPFRVVKERRATPAQTPEACARRPGARTGAANLFLAGDWTATGLPATIEGAVRSGFLAARLARGRS
ncbi:MAG: FAD-dependent oxidoreductase [Proteobacteria bacterium]|nr:FAD-dependent oxidoreductase [Pseudomonadota bacterium]